MRVGWFDAWTLTPLIKVNDRMSSSRIMRRINTTPLLDNVEADIPTCNVAASTALFSQILLTGFTRVLGKVTRFAYEI